MKKRASVGEGETECIEGGTERERRDREREERQRGERERWSGERGTEIEWRDY